MALRLSTVAFLRLPRILTLASAPFAATYANPFGYDSKSALVTRALTSPPAFAALRSHAMARLANFPVLTWQPNPVYPRVFSGFRNAMALRLAEGSQRRTAHR